jgi:hypothetical protein
VTVSNRLHLINPMENVMNQTTDQATANVTTTASTDATQTLRTPRPMLPQSSAAFRAAAALAGGVVAVALLGAVVLGLTSQPDPSSVAGQTAAKPAAKGAVDASAGVAHNANPL